MRRCLTSSWVVTCFVSMLLAAGPAQAADTVEPTDAGAIDIEGYVGWEGLGLVRHERGVLADTVLGIGIFNRFSAYVGATFTTCEFFCHTSGVVNMGLLGTVLETDHVDIDLSVDGSVSPAGEGGFSIGPSVELNIDARPDLQLWGGYLRVGIPLGGFTSDPSAEGLHAHHGVTIGLVAVAGVYVTMAESHQLLLEADLFYDLADDQAGRDFDFGSIALGYNVVIVEALELITHVYVDVPTHGEPPSVGFLVGFIGTITYRD